MRQQATAIVAVPNHPSGTPIPLAADVALTVESGAAVPQLDIELLDHLIIGQGRWLSLKRLDMGFPKAENTPLSCLGSRAPVRQSAKSTTDRLY